MSEMKPCPFCGSSKYLLEYDEPIMLDDLVIHQYRVICSMATHGKKQDGGCGASSGIRDTRNDAIKAWNRRSDI